MLEPGGSEPIDERSAHTAPMREAAEGDTCAARSDQHGARTIEDVDLRVARQEREGQRPALVVAGYDRHRNFAIGYSLQE